MTTAMKLGTFGAWFNPAYDDVARTRFIAEAEAVGYTAAWLGMGRGAVADLDLVERALDATSTIVVVTAIVNMWTNDAASIARSYHRISAKHGERFLLGVGLGHPESIAEYRSRCGDHGHISMSSKRRASRRTVVFSQPLVRAPCGWRPIERRAHTHI